MIREMKTLNNINLLSPSCWKELFVLLTIFFFSQKSHSKKHNNKKTQSLTHGVFSDPSSPGLDLLWSPFGSSMFMLFPYSVGKWQDSWERKGQPLLRPELQENCWRALTALKPFSCGWGCASWLWDNIRLGQLPLPHISWFPWCVTWMCRRKLQHLLGRTYSG